MTVAEIARTDPIAATRRASIAEVASLMNENMVGSVIIEQDDRPVGIVTDRDIAMKVTAEGKDPHAITAEDVMTADPVTIEKDAGVYELIDLMSEHGVRRMPVVDGDTLYGIVTLDDIDRLLGDEHSKLAKVQAMESPPY